MNQEKENKDFDDDKMPEKGKPNFLTIILIGFVITFFLNILVSIMLPSRKTQIEYSQFVKLVESGVVQQVQIEAEQIALTLKPDADQQTVSTILSVGKIEEPEIDEEVQKRMDQYNVQIKKNQVYYTGRIDDPGLVDRLIEYDIAFYQPIVQSNPILTFITSWIFPILIMYLIMRWLTKRMGAAGGLGGVMNVGKSKAKVYDLEKNTGVTFDDVAGQDEAKESLSEMVDFLHSPEKYSKIGAKQPKGALLVGPPGTGKTLLAKAVAGEAKVPFFSLSGSEFVEMFVGVGASRVRDLFEQANKNAPCIIFIDEIDAIGKSRDNQLGGNDEREQTLNQLLAEMDGFDSSKGIIVLAATNRPEVLDKALLRPGRFDRRVIVEKPDLPGREAILKVHTAKVLTGSDVNLHEIALATSGATGADLANMVNEAALRAVRMGRQLVCQEDLMESVELVIAGKEKKDRILNQKEKRMVAFHEVGHALASTLQKNSQPVQKITIVPRTMGSLGYTMNMPEEERYLMTKEELLTQITTLLAGRAAEETIFGEMTTGASNDIERATNLARSMVTQYGMSEKFGMMGLESIENQYLDGRRVSNTSEVTGAEIDKEVCTIIKDCHKTALKLMQDNRAKLNEIAEFLIEKETISGTQFMDILKSKNTADTEAK
ncbi:ATP-dependent zinc metalloprotease FtsH [Brucepastera parasyntrophica]|uniref:ATP-dependent zinc metalloprotease FtsH n=1 Tax=Brucepastera parasyntrophica TaxID=2880008 RepID=UPI00210D9BDF|nr:ATP-dependent zinc metalloprotease FtsH [Brucepastera parasyntrophica]ULQ59953.1 ATP-dependent zinc metalloprotease FtsH [Brucepastera parasyntrophica]